MPPAIVILRYSVPFAELIGVSLRAGIANGIAALVSFFFGLFVDPHRQKLTSLPVALVGLCLLMVALVGIAYAGERSCRVEEENERHSTGKRGDRVAATRTGYIGKKSGSRACKNEFSLFQIIRKLWMTSF